MSLGFWANSDKSADFSFSLFVSPCYILGSDVARLTQSRQTRQHELPGSLLRYCNFFPIIFFSTWRIFLGSSCWCFGAAVPTGSSRNLGTNFGKPAAVNVIIFSSYFEVRCQTALLKRSGNGKWNVAFVKMPRAVFIRPATPCKIRGRCFQKRTQRFLAEPRFSSKNNLPTASQWAGKTKSNKLF